MQLRAPAPAAPASAATSAPHEAVQLTAAVEPRDARRPAPLSSPRDGSAADHRLPGDPRGWEATAPRTDPRPVVEPVSPARRDGILADPASPDRDVSRGLAGLANDLWPRGGPGGLDTRRAVDHGDSRAHTEQPLPAQQLHGARTSATVLTTLAPPASSRPPSPSPQQPQVPPSVDLNKAAARAAAAPAGLAPDLSAASSAVSETVLRSQSARRQWADWLQRTPWRAAADRSATAAARTTAPRRLPQ